MTVIETAHAKINLYLDVVAKRENGYHDVITVMQSVSLADTLTVTRTAGVETQLDTGGTLPVDESNLIVRAARAYFAAGAAPFGTKTVLEKRIPMQAGMGGGSADAAAMLRALNRLDGDRFSIEKLAEIGAGIGADVPFCVVGGTQLCRGIGEVMTPAKNRLATALVIAIDGEGVSTPAAFAALDARYRDFADFLPQRSPSALLAALEKGDITDTVHGLFNRFEEVIEPQRPAVAALKAHLLKNGALAAQMSGSGPSVFGVFSDVVTAERAAKALCRAGARAFACEFAAN